VSPDFDFPPSSDEDERPRKRGRKEHSPARAVAVRSTVDTLGDDEALALEMLRTSR
jgi:hypothetical protein